MFPENENEKHKKNCGDNSGMVLLYDGELGDTIIACDIDLIRNIILKIRYLVLSYLHIGLHTRDVIYWI